MPITFGSVGDIIAIALIVKDLIEALEKSRGASAEYKALIRDLRLLEDILSKVEVLANTHETTFELAALYQTVRRTTEICRESIVAFKARLTKYEPTLGNDKANKVKSTLSKIRFHVGEKEDVAKFRAEIAGHVASLNVLISATSWSFSKGNKDSLSAFGSLTRDHLDAQDSALSRIDSALRDNSRMIAENRTVLDSIIDGLSWLRQLGSQLTAAMSNVLFINIATYKAVLSLQNMLPSHLERTLIGEPFLLEDAIGRMSPVHLQFINSWSALETVLETRFRGIQGHDKVQSGEYVFQEHRTGLEISWGRNWEGAFMPGQKINMSLVFQRHMPAQETVLTETTCPRCGHTSTKAIDSDVQCAGCGLCYRRITEIHEVDPEPSIPLPKPWTVPPAFGEASFKPAYGPIPAPKKKKRETADELAVSTFKRIRVVSRVDRPRRHGFGASGKGGSSTSRSVRVSTMAARDVSMTESRERATPVAYPVSWVCLERQFESRPAATAPVFPGFLAPEAARTTNMLWDQSAPEAPEVATRSSRDVTEIKDDPASPKMAAATTRSPLIDTTMLDDIRKVGSTKDKPGKYSLEDVEMGTTIGKGSFGRIRLVKSKHNQRFYALEQISRSQQVSKRQVGHTYTGARIQQTYRHPFITHAWGAFHEGENIYSVMEFAEGGELYSLLSKVKRFRNLVARFYAAEVILALDFLHSHSIIYGDDRPENILLDWFGHIKLTGFGCAKAIDGFTGSMCGTPDCLAPEVIAGGTYGKEVDWWALGVLVYEMLVGYSRFWNIDKKRISKNIISSEVEYPAYVHPDAETLMMNLLVRNPADRLGYGLVDALPIMNHAWFAEVEWERLAKKDVDAPYVPPVEAGTGDTSMYDMYAEEKEISDEGDESDESDENNETDETDENDDDDDDASYHHLFPNF